MTQSDHFDSIIQALRRRDTAKASSILKDAQAEGGFDINARTLSGLTLVHMFTNGSRGPELSWLASAGADLDAFDNTGETPLSTAVSLSDVGAVRALLMAGADPTINNKQGVSPLLQAVLNQKEGGISEMLLAAGALPDQASPSGATPLLAAATRGRAELVKILLQAGANPEMSDYQGIGLLTSAVLARDTGDGAAAVLAVIREHSPIFLDPNACARSGTSAMAAAIGQPELIEIFLEMGGDPSARQMNRFHEGATLLQSVAARGKVELPVVVEEDGSGAPEPDPIRGLVEKMIAGGADPNARDGYGNNAGAAALLCPEVMAALVAGGLNVSRPLDAPGSLPYDGLAQLAKMGKLDLDRSKTWITRMNGFGFGFERPVWDEVIDGVLPPLPPGAELNIPRPPLQVLATSDFSDLAWHCVSLGAKPNVRDKAGRTVAHHLLEVDGMLSVHKKALALARRAKNMDPAETQQQVDVILQAAKDRLESIRKSATSAGVVWDIQDGEGNTPLHLAARTGNAEWAKWLINEANADLLIRNNQGLTVVGEALKHGRSTLAYSFLKIAESRGHDLRTDLLADTVLASSDDVFQRGEWLNALESLKVPLGFTSEDIKPSSRDEEARHPVFLAAATGMIDVSRVLLQLGGDPNATDAQGNTALMAAMFQKCTAIVRQLRSMNADLSIRNHSGQDASDLAAWLKLGYIRKSLIDDDGLSQVRDDIMGIVPVVDEETLANEIEDKAWFQQYLDMSADFFFDRATEKDLSDLRWNRPSSVRERTKQELLQAERVAELEARKAAAAASAPPPPAVVGSTSVEVEVEPKDLHSGVAPSTSRLSP